MKNEWAPLKVGLRVSSIVYQILWLDFNLNGDLYLIVPTNKALKKQRGSLVKDGRKIQNNFVFDHISFHSDGTVHWRLKGKKYFDRKKTTPLFIMPEKSVVLLSQMTFALKNINFYYPEDRNRESHNIIEAPHTEFACLYCFLATMGNWLGFYERYAKKYDQTKGGPILVDTGINSKVLLLIVSEYVPKEVCSDYLVDQCKKMGSEYYHRLIGGFGVLPPVDYFENLTTRSSRRSE